MANWIFKPMGLNTKVNFNYHKAIKNTYLIIFLSLSASIGDVKRLCFDAIYKDGGSEAKYSDLIPSLNSFMNGKNLCIFTHGVTGEISMKSIPHI